ncbi:MAG: prolyl oligopeptidase family serine peptidase, partial [Planctomycetota bacterium]|nr:prolyl oligopeptidase family serine peptidase [Planctomycetota bacterium]
QGQCKVNLEIMKDGEITDAETVTLRIRRPEQSYKQTFRSRIDGSVQYYAVNPAASVAADARPALFLTLHGATVQASGQVDSYSPKDWGHVVAPTNRRPFGFDWEDWGRIDAIEVLEIVQKRLRTDPQRTYLTGHSMGGHGVWHVGAIYPDRFAAIGPSAGWISFWTYAGGVASYKNPTPIEQILMRSVAASQTLALSANYGQYGVYILHGEKDNEVPVEQSRRMNRHLRKFHKDVVYHEQPDVKHWWDLSKDRPGTDCVDWPAMFDFFARHKNTPAGQVEKVDFVTVNPGISAWSDWVGIIAQIHHLQPSSVSIRYDAAGRRFVGETKNVVCLALDLRHLEPGKPIHVELDGQKGENIPWPGAEKRIWLAREGGNWKTVLKPAAAIKGPHRYGPFKQAFDNRVMFVYGTTGTPAENAWAYAKARYDAETFWYRGNGSIDVIPDTAFDASADRDRSVIIYGNADTNAAWAALLGDSPVQVGRGVIRVGRAKIAESEALACLFIRPRPESDTALVAAVSGMGLAGMKLTNRLPYFVSGVGYPDCIVIAPEMFQRATGGIIMAGFFGLNWSVETGEFAWAKTE